MIARDPDGGQPPTSSITDGLNRYERLLEGLREGEPTAATEASALGEPSPGPILVSNQTGIHDPAKRVVVLHMRDWELRAFSKEDPHYQTYAARALLHLQLYHPVARVSVLTPSHLTRGRLEVYPIKSRRVRLSSYWQLRDILVRYHGVEPPSPPVLAAAIRWFVVRVTRTSAPPGVDLSAMFPEIDGLSGDSVLPVENLVAEATPSQSPPPVEEVGEHN